MTSWYVYFHKFIVFRHVFIYFYFQSLRWYFFRYPQNGVHALDLKLIFVNKLTVYSSLSIWINSLPVYSSPASFLESNPPSGRSLIHHVGASFRAGHWSKNTQINVAALNLHFATALHELKYCIICQREQCSRRSELKMNWERPDENCTTSSNLCQSKRRHLSLLVCNCRHSKMRYWSFCNDLNKPQLTTLTHIRNSAALLSFKRCTSMPLLISG